MAELRGVIMNVLPQVTGNGKNGKWYKQEFVIEYGEEYAYSACFSVWGDKVKELQEVSVGDRLEIKYRPVSNEYDGRWLTELRAWRIIKLN